MIALVPVVHNPAAAQEASDHATGFMLRRALKVTSALELDGATLCVQHMAMTELDIANYFKSNNMAYGLASFSLPQEVFAAYDAGRCNAVAADVSELYAARLRLTNPDHHVVLPERLSHAPLGQ